MKNSSLIITTIIMAILSLVAFYFAYGKGKHMEGLVIAKNLTIQILPMLVFAFILAGLLQVLIPREFIANWIGNESGLKGIFIGSIAGAFLPGGPYITLPIAAGVMKLGASIPVTVAMVTGWSLVGISRLPMDFAIMGPRFTLIRLASVFIFAPLAGAMAWLLMRILKL
ncbi:permease [Candidatus Falkowbacteria bacterium CG11_big_fil_rev_8_21_14_0_20_39_10]|uniref:Permease n=1 Tax=Candidatus Falkowbacteria bacterium CG11_big_fil_rev_8_21_14_0_20_39_10 TaxID=1974570 RepID=A0A2M6K9T9_9BACT|nr:MAG: permease [Candidatus Falkowbacteria bacterium CG11_big_fil_rev_8_21_14_0_20_39_10]